MSANIEQFADGTAAFVSAREHAWHKLGTVVPEAMSIPEALQLAYLADWDVQAVPLIARVPVPIVTGNGPAMGTEDIPVPNKFATVRTNPKTQEYEVLGIVGKVWTPAQNEEVAELLGYVVDQTKGIVETAGSLNDGQKVFISVKLPSTMQIGGKDQVDLYLVAVNSHGGGGLHILITPVRVVCQNTLDAAMSNFERKLTLRHTTNLKDAMADARQKLDLAFEYCDAFEKEAQRLFEQELTVKRFENMADRVLRDPKENAGQKALDARAAVIDTLRTLWLEGENNEGIHGTRWGAYNAFTEYFDHIRPVKAGEEDAAIARARRTLTNEGTARRKNTAWQLLTTAK